MESRDKLPPVLPRLRHLGDRHPRGRILCGLGDGKGGAAL